MIGNESINIVYNGGNAIAHITLSVSPIYSCSFFISFLFVDEEKFSLFFFGDLGEISTS